MSRLVPLSVLQKYKISNSYEDVSRETGHNKISVADVSETVEKKKKDAKDLAIKRTKDRQNILDEFADRHGLTKDSDLICQIKKIMTQRSSAKIPLASYQSDLNIISQYWNEHDVMFFTSIVANNALKGYKNIIFENQINPSYKASKANNTSIKDNIQSKASSKSVKQMTLEECIPYGVYVSQDFDKDIPEHINELITWCETNLQTTVVR